jgi:hypothetical protein
LTGSVELPPTWIFITILGSAGELNFVSCSDLSSYERTPILKEMEEAGQIKIVGAFYRLTDGTFEIF